MNSFPIVSRVLSRGFSLQSLLDISCGNLYFRFFNELILPMYSNVSGRYLSAKFGEFYSVGYWKQEILKNSHLNSFL